MTGELFLGEVIIIHYTGHTGTICNCVNVCFVDIIVSLFMYAFLVPL